MQACAVRHSVIRQAGAAFCNSAGEGRGPSAPVLGFGGRLDGRKGMGSAVGRP
eukprot:COSAG01_NODE_51840_length_351_cov_1.214286_1_plen_52_part_10